jgi:D-alanyl-D-alanine carboxypeptidase
MAKLRMPKNKRKLAVILLSILLIGIVGYVIFGRSEPAKAPSIENHQPVSQTEEPKPEAEPTPAPAFNKNLHSLDDPASLWVVVNKKRPLPSSYAPGVTSVGGGSLRPEAAQAIRQLIDGAATSSVRLKVISGYRSFGTQQSVYQSYVRNDGQARADTYSARPGYSEHQTGLAADLGGGGCDLEICFANTPGGRWLTQHAHEYGFIIRYLQGKTSVTGYQYEPWHLRYVGKELATEIKKSGLTMEEFFGLPAAPGY